MLYLFYAKHGLFSRVKIMIYRSLLHLKSIIPEAAISFCILSLQTLVWPSRISSSNGLLLLHSPLKLHILRRHKQDSALCPIMTFFWGLPSACCRCSQWDIAWTDQPGYGDIFCEVGPLMSDCLETPLNPLPHSKFATIS